MTGKPGMRMPKAGFWGTITWKHPATDWKPYRQQLNHNLK